MSVPKKMRGQTINCPLNGCLIQVNDDGVASGAANSRTSPAVNGSVAPRPAPLAASAVPPAAAPSSSAMTSAEPPMDWMHQNVARFIAADKTPAPMQLAGDGRLPELSLQEGRDRRRGESSSGSNPLVLMGVLCLSLVMSTVLLLVDFQPPQSQGRQKAEARRSLAEFYRQPREELLPYQQYLRDAQRAHSRGDYETERQLYRRVLGLLRAEGRSRFASVTRTPREDKELEALLAVLLAEE